LCSSSEKGPKDSDGRRATVPSQWTKTQQTIVGMATGRLLRRSVLHLRKRSCGGSRLRLRGATP
jgi:hypothetical protein